MKCGHTGRRSGNGRRERSFASRGSGYKYRCFRRSHAGGLESQILRLALNGELRLYVSPPILREYAEVLARPKFRFTKSVQQQIVEGIKRAALVVAPMPHLLVCSDPEDNMFLECSEAARADYLISGNLRHFPSMEIDSRGFEPPISRCHVGHLYIFS